MRVPEGRQFIARHVSAGNVCIVELSPAGTAERPPFDRLQAVLSHSEWASEAEALSVKVSEKFE
jgi:hypothetical protein